MRFERPEIIRPPSEARSYFLPLTSGCSNNSCTFCNFYGCRLQVREPEDVKQELDAVALYLERRLTMPDIPQIVYEIADQWDGKRIFLQDGDALVYPYPHLKTVLEYSNRKFPILERVASYATAQDILRRTIEELSALKILKLGILYMGIESGDNQVLQQIGKGVNYDQLVEAGRKVKKAGILLSVTVILGVGGVENSREHALATARILTDIDPDYAGALTLTIVPGTPFHDQCLKHEFSPISPFQSLQELKMIIENSNFTHCFFSSMHASNYLSVRGMLPEDKQRMLSQIDYVLSRKDPSLLKPEYMRGL